MNPPWLEKSTNQSEHEDPRGFHETAWNSTRICSWADNSKDSEKQFLQLWYATVPRYGKLKR